MGFARGHTRAVGSGWHHRTGSSSPATGIGSCARFSLAVTEEFIHLGCSDPFGPSVKSKMYVMKVQLC